MKLAVTSYFNSIKVRLEQFDYAIPEFDSVFQFHKGTIRTLHAYQSTTKTCHFNSIKVRLEQGVAV